MSASERQSAPLTATAMVVREVDPLLKDLNEKKQSFRRNVVSLAAELKEMRSRLATQEKCVARETLTRQEAELRSQVMEEEVIRLQKSLEEKNVQLQASTSAAETYVEELEDLRVQITEVKAIADASSVSAKAAELHCSALVNEIEEKTYSLKQHVIRTNKLEEKLDFLLKGLRAREFSEMQLKGEVSRIEHEVMQTLANVGSHIDHELQKILEEASPRNFDEINQLLTLKDEEIAKLRDDIKIISAHWKLKTKELESQLDKHRRADQELKKKVMKLEFCLQEARVQTRKLQRMGERRDKAFKELVDQLATNTKQASSPSGEVKQNFWDTSGFKIVISMSMLVLVVFSKR